MSDLNRIRLENTVQLGSLEDTQPVKRLTATEIRRMRSMTHEQTKVGFSIIRWITMSWSHLNSSMSLVFTKPTKDCDKNGHTAYRGQGGLLKCRYCGIEISSLEQLFTSSK